MATSQNMNPCEPLAVIANGAGPVTRAEPVDNGERAAVESLCLAWPHRSMRTQVDGSKRHSIDSSAVAQCSYGEGGVQRLDHAILIWQDIDDRGKRGNGIGLLVNSMSNEVDNG
ncbi:unnamed protein product [Fusarium graminearum]|uniref:Chromosome 3, complete genome n=2 Tax=Gibberella zeae TaxID=5518 RepID=I1SAP5_GIBZE|nr:hypothetical protein FGSG_13926 [Fusarium graminearum PH-1]EYB34160.1 hypothetical protein FG05_13926 [Fusarium graminearum]ESU18039.1 hypothetical protein FGSG_13926 [Fusarium graminearum PH-1]CAF3481206.1 unnamed protein product [Fusarium graminearum]CAF3634875.1 unnamed protein product [Fusarium graminearum]CAG1973409.1 unnamed protein product [Fusarium graminearum]|eukprot:XP_011325661.1 hypothetical protein FGSG_13926 [Fusarium graminearum PH-1]